MVRPVNDRDEHAFELDHDPGEEPDAPLSDEALLDLLNALVAERGRVPAAEALEVNCRTLALCCDSREVSRRMRQALVDFRDAGAADGHGDVAPEVGDGKAGERDGDALEQRVDALVPKKAGLRKMIEAQTGQLEELSGTVGVGRRWATTPERVRVRASLPECRGCATRCGSSFGQWLQEVQQFRRAVQVPAYYAPTQVPLSLVVVVAVQFVRDASQQPDLVVCCG